MASHGAAIAEHFGWFWVGCLGRRTWRLGLFALQPGAVFALLQTIWAFDRQLRRGYPDGRFRGSILPNGVLGVELKNKRPSPLLIAFTENADRDPSAGDVPTGGG